MALALRTNIAPAVWASEDERTIYTALELLAEADEDTDSGGGRVIASSG